jgi:hypothetical protein
VWTVTYVDMHAQLTPPTQNGKDTSSPDRPFPTGCLSTIMTAQELALEFLFFDAGACIP